MDTKLIINILEIAKTLVVHSQYCNRGLCKCIAVAHNKMLGLDDMLVDIEQIIPEFTFSNAENVTSTTKYKFEFGPDPDFWWILEDRKSRIEFIDWLIEQYKKKENEND